jgi:hypothetical protein
MYIMLVKTRSIAIRLGVIAAASVIGRCCVSCSLVCLLVLAVISIIVMILVLRLLVVSHACLVVIVVLYVFVVVSVVSVESGRSGAGSLGLQLSVAFVVARRRIRIDGRRRRTLRTNHGRVEVAALGTLLGASA